MTVYVGGWVFLYRFFLTFLFTTGSTRHRTSLTVKWCLGSWTLPFRRSPRTKDQSPSVPGLPPTVETVLRLTGPLFGNLPVTDCPEPPTCVSRLNSEGMSIFTLSLTTTNHFLKLEMGEGLGGGRGGGRVYDDESVLWGNNGDRSVRVVSCPLVSTTEYTTLYLFT